MEKAKRIGLDAYKTEQYNLFFASDDIESKGTL
jgi:hypothetical protein